MFFFFTCNRMLSYWLKLSWCGNLDPQEVLKTVWLWKVQMHLTLDIECICKNCEVRNSQGFHSHKNIEWALPGHPDTTGNGTEAAVNQPATALPFGIGIDFHYWILTKSWHYQLIFIHNVYFLMFWFIFSWGNNVWLFSFTFLSLRRLL